MISCTVRVSISSLHSESISFMVTDAPKPPLILVITWLHLHNALISWTNQEMNKHSEYCQKAIEEHCPVNIPCICWVFVYGKGREVSNHRLPWLEPYHSQLHITAATGACCPGRTLNIWKLDLHRTCNLVRIRAGDEWETTYSTTSGHY